jgi:ABC-type sugar transport system substrate-binding protein
MANRRGRYEQEKQRHEIEAEFDAFVNNNVSRRSFLRGAAGAAAIVGVPGLLAACGSSKTTSTPSTGSNTPTTGSGSQASQIAAKYGDITIGDSWHSLVLDIIADRAKGGEEAAAALGQTYQGISANLSAITQISQIQSACASGMKGLNTVPIEAPEVTSIYAACAASHTFFTTFYNSPAWKTPTNYGPEYITYGAPDDYLTGTLTAGKLCEHLKGKGSIVHIQGVAGATAETLRTKGVTETLAKYPGIKLAASVHTDWSTVDANSKMQSLLSSVGTIDGVIAADDDVGIGVYSAIRAAGKQIPITSSDGTKAVFDAIENSFYLGTVNTGTIYVGGYFVVRMFDALHGWQPAPAETMMFGPTTWVDKSSVSKVAASAYGGGPSPYDWPRMSHILHPNDWDPQGSWVTMNPSYVWQYTPQPAGYSLPAGFDAASRATVDKLYADHWKSRSAG